MILYKPLYEGLEIHSRVRPQLHRELILGNETYSGEKLSNIPTESWGSTAAIKLLPVALIALRCLGAT